MIILKQEDVDINASPQIKCQCGTVMPIKRTKTKRIHSCSICKSSHVVDIASRTIFGCDIFISDQIPKQSFDEELLDKAFIGMDKQKPKLKLLTGHERQT